MNIYAGHEVINLKRKIPELIVIVLLLLSLIIFFMLSKKDKESNIHNSGKNENGLYPQQTYDASIVDTDEFYRTVQKAISKKDFISKQVVHIGQSVKFTYPFRYTSKYDTRNGHPDDSVQCPVLSMKINNVYITDSYNEHKESGCKYLIIDTSLTNCFDSDIVYCVKNMIFNEYKNEDDIIVHTGQKSIAKVKSSDILVDKMHKGVKTIHYSEDYSTQFIVTETGKGNNDELYTEANEEFNFRIVLPLEENVLEGIMNYGFVVQQWSGRCDNYGFSIIINDNDIIYKESMTWDSEEWWLN